MNTTLPQDSQLRKEYPLYDGCLAYFPAALAGVARHSKKGNDQHNKGQPMHHARWKSTDHKNCIIRHLTDLGDVLKYEHISPQTILDEVNALAWRALALSQELHEKIGGAPLAPGAKVAPEFTDAQQSGYAQAAENMGWKEPLPAGRRTPYPLLQGYPNPRCAICQRDPCTCKG